MIFKILLKRKKTGLILFLTLFALIVSILHSVNYHGTLFVQAQDNPQLQWLSYDKALTRSKVENIPTLLYFYSDSCFYCRRLEEETFSNKEIQNLLNKDFALAKINVNSSQTVLIEGKKLTENRLSTEVYQINGVPTVWFLNSANERIGSLPGFRTPEEYISILIYIRDGFYKEYTYQEFLELKKNSQK